MKEQPKCTIDSQASNPLRKKNEGIQLKRPLILGQNSTRVNDTIKTLQQLGIESIQEIDKLGKDAAKVK